MYSSTINPVITIIGAGAYGTAMAIALANSGNSVVLWGRNSIHLQELMVKRCNQVYLPNIKFPPSLYIETSLSAALDACSDLLIAVPSKVFNKILIRLKLILNHHNIRIVIASKGLEPETGRFLKDVTRDILGNDVPVAIISGPTFARELAMGLPTAMTLASTNITLSLDMQNLLHCNNNFRVYRSTDIVGVQLAGAVKNVIAIGAGISDGIGFGSNARIALITRGLSEMSRLGIAVGSKSDVFVGLAGLGDLVLTCTDDQSRNRRFGVLIGKGIDVYHAQKDIGQVIEGLCNVKEIYYLSIKYGVDMPITEQIYKILFEHKNVHDAVHALLNRTQKEESGY